MSAAAAEASEATGDSEPGAGGAQPSAAESLVKSAKWIHTYMHARATTGEAKLPTVTAGGRDHKVWTMSGTISEAHWPDFILPMPNPLISRGPGMTSHGRVCH